jgi:hypothetical protein
MLIGRTMERFEMFRELWRGSDFNVQKVKGNIWSGCIYDVQYGLVRVLRYPDTPYPCQFSSPSSPPKD